MAQEPSSSSSSSAALLSMLRELEDAGRITADQHEYFAYKVRALAATVDAFRGSEARLSDAEAHLRARLAAQRAGMRRLTETQLAAAGSVAGMNRDVARSEADIGMAREREEETHAALERLASERTSLQDELEQQRVHADTVVAPRLAALRRTNDELQDALERERALLLSLGAERDAQRALLETARAARDEAATELAAVAREAARTRGKPEHVRHQIEQLEAACATMAADIERTEAQIRDAEAAERDVRRGVSAREEELRQQTAQHEAVRQEIDQRERLGERAMRELEEAKARGLDLHAQRMALDLQDKHAAVEQRHAEDRLASRKREFAKQVKMLQKMQADAEAARRAIPDLERVRAERRKELEHAREAQRKQRAALEHERIELDILISSLLQEKDLQAGVREDLEKTRHSIAESQDTLQHLEEQEAQLRKSLVEIAQEREQKAHEASASRARVLDVNKRLRACDTEIIELQRQLADAQAACADYLQVFERVKAERKKHLDVLSKSSLVRREYADRIKAAESELEILQEETRRRDQLLSAEEQDFGHTRQRKDEMRADVNKLVYARQREEEHSRHLAVTHEKLEAQVKAAQHEIASLRSAYEAAVDVRNAVATQVVNRNRQLVLLHMQRNSQETEVQSGNQELARKDEERRVLEVVLTETRRELEALSRVVKHGIPAQVREIESLREQLRKERARSVELAAKLESPQDSADRWAVLAGVDPSPEELAAKLDNLDQRSLEVDAKLRQKAVLLEELEKRAQELLLRRDSTRAEASGTLAKVNELRGKVLRLDGKIMAALAELSLFRAQAMQLEQASKDLRALVSEAIERMAAGKAPTVDAEREWFNLELRRQLKQKEQAQAQAQAPNTTTWGERTMAPRRFATYVPEDGLPRAYGSHPPFMPSETDPAARIFRRSQPPPDVQPQGPPT